MAEEITHCRAVGDATGEIENAPHGANGAHVMPDGWSVCSLAEVVERDRKICYGIVQPGENTAGGIPLIRGRDYSFGWAPLDEFYRVSEQIDRPYRRSKVRPNDLLLTIVGAGTGNVAVVPEWLDGANITQTTARIAVDRARHDFRFVKALLESDYGKRAVHRAIKGGAQPGLNIGDVELFEFAFPPHAEQKRIADILSTWDRAIEVIQALIRNARIRKRALTESLLTGQLRLPGFSDDWATTSLGLLGTTFGGLAGKSKADFGVGSPYVTYKNVFDNPVLDPNGVDFVNISAGERQHVIRFGDVLFTVSSETREEVGMSSVVMFEAGNMYLNSFCFGFRPAEPDAIVAQFAAHFFRSDEMRKQIVGLAQGSTRYNISKGQLLKLRFRLPGPSEQRAIAEVLDDAQAEVDRHVFQLNALRDEKAALMQQLLTGKRRVNVDQEAA